MLRRILSTILVFIALAAIAGGIVYWVYDGYMYYRTDDAQVSGPIVSISAQETGILSSLTVTVGQTVSAGEAIGTITLPSLTAGGARSLPATTVNLNSPTNGTIVQIPAVQGQAVVPGLQLAILTNLSALTITAYVDEGSISNIGANQAVDIHLDAYGATNFAGHVVQIVQATAGEFSLLPNEDPTSGNFTKVGQRVPVLITLDNKNGKDIVPGMSAEVTIHLH
jgi:multidrug resistance efflux pump